MAAKEKINKIEKFLRGEKGQRFFNFAYSIGAAIVIWGALFKILHLPGGSALLCIGMGTEIAMFIITAFDRPSKEYAWEEVFPQLGKKRHAEGVAAVEGEDAELSDEEYAAMGADGVHYAGGGYAGGGGGTVVIGGGSGGGGGTVIIGGGGSGSGEDYEGAEGAGGPIVAGSGVIGGGVIGGGPVVAGGGVAGSGGGVVAGGGGVIGGGMIAPGLEVSEEDATSLHDSISKMAAAADQLAQMAELTTATQTYLERIAGIADQMTRLQETTAELNNVSSILLDSYKAITENSATISESSQGYVESMADLNRNIGGLNTIYEIQLKSISSQLESIDRVNRGLKDIRDMYEKSARQSSRYCEETERMTRYMTQLNSVYEKMVTAMTINMYNPMMGQPRREDDFNPFGPRENGNSEHQREEN